MQNQQPEPPRRESDARHSSEEHENINEPGKGSEELNAVGNSPLNSVDPATEATASAAPGLTGETAEAKRPERHDSASSMFGRPRDVSSEPIRPRTTAYSASVSTGTHSGASTPLSSPINQTIPTTGNENFQAHTRAASADVPVPPHTTASQPTQDHYQPPVPLATAIPEDSPDTPRATAEPESEPAGLLDLMDSEEVLSEVDSGDDGRFVLTNHRLIYQGRSSGDSVFSSAAVEDVTAIHFGRRTRESRSAWWGVVGLIAAVAVWQVTSNETVGAVAGAIVGGISLLMLADYWFRPAGLVLRFSTAGGSVEGPVANRRMQDAERLAAMVQRAGRHGSPASSSSGSTPPGGSPGLR